MKKVLLVDADPLSLCVLDVGLRKSGYAVTTAADGGEALEKFASFSPDLVLTDTRLPNLDGIALVAKLRDEPGGVDAAVMFLASIESFDDRKRALELGVEDYLAKPIFLSELTARIDLLLARRTRDRVGVAALASRAKRTRCAGTTRDLALVDLLQGFELSRKSGVLDLHHDRQDARLYFRDGQVVDAELGFARGEEVVYRALMWSDAAFEIEFKPVTNEDILGCTTSLLVMKGMQRVDDWVRLCEQVQPLAALFDVGAPQLLERLSQLGEPPERLSAMLHLSPPPGPLAALPQSVGSSPRSSRPSVIDAEISRSAPPPSVVSSSAAPPPVSHFSAPASVPAPATIPAPPPVAAAPFSAPAPSSVPRSATPRSVAPALDLLSPGAPRVAVTPSSSSAAHPSSPPSQPPSAIAVPPPPPVPHDLAPDGAVVLPLAADRQAPARSAAASPAAPAAVSATLITRAPAEPIAPAAPARIPSFRPSAAPWTREIGADSPHHANDDVAAGVPRALSLSSKRTLLGGLAAAAVLVLGLGVYSSRGGPGRTAEATGDSDRTAAAAGAGGAATGAAAIGAAPLAPNNGVPAEPIRLAPAEPPTVSTLTPIAATDHQPPSGAVAAAAAPGNLADVPLTPAVAAPPSREVALDLKTALTSKSPLIRDAERALLQGQTDRAVTLAQQAVGENPADADAWLTLAAARKASGDMAAALEAYNHCMAQAQTAGVSDCRILARTVR